MFLIVLILLKSYDKKNINNTHTWSPRKSIKAAVVALNILFPVESSWIWRYTCPPVYKVENIVTTSKYL